MISLKRLLNDDDVVFDKTYRPYPVSTSNTNDFEHAVNDPATYYYDEGTTTESFQSDTHLSEDNLAYPAFTDFTGDILSLLDISYDANCLPYSPGGQLPQDDHFNHDAWAAVPLQTNWSTTGTTYETPEYSICLGMIYRVRVKLRGDMGRIDTKLSSENIIWTSGYHAFHVAGKDENEICIVFPDGESFALLNKSLTDSLQTLLRGGLIQLEAMVYLETIREAIGNALKSSDATFTLNINVYAQSENRVKVGNQLSSAKVWLQRVDRLRVGSRYDNPHILPLPGARELCNVPIHPELLKVVGQLEDYD